MSLITDDITKQITGNAGTRYYRAPEVYRGSFNYNCDLYSLGMVLCFMVMSSIVETDKFEDIMEDQITKHKINSIVSKLCHPDPDCRKDITEILTDSFFE